MVIIFSKKFFKYRRVGSEGAKTRESEVAEAQSELTALRQKLEQVRTEKQAVERSVQETEAAWETEAAGAKEAQDRANELTAQLEQERSRAAELAGQLEQEKALGAQRLRESEERAGERLARQDRSRAEDTAASTRPSERTATHSWHAAVAEFWRSYDHSAVAATAGAGGRGEVSRIAATAADREHHPVPDAAAPAGEDALDTRRDDAAAPASSEPPRPAVAQGPARASNTDVIDEDGIDGQAAAMRAALAAAKAEIAAEKTDDSDGAETPHQSPAAPAARAGSAPTPVKFTADLLKGKPAGKQKKKTKDTEPPPDLDPETAAKLRLMRRLNPGKSYDELLDQIKRETGGPSAKKQQSKKKKKWF